MSNVLCRNELIHCSKEPIEIERGKEIAFKNVLFSVVLSVTRTHIYHPHLRIHAFGFSPNSSYMHCLDSRWISWISYQFAWWWRHQSQRRFSSFSHFACFIYLSLSRVHSPLRLRQFPSRLPTTCFLYSSLVFSTFFPSLACLHARTARCECTCMCVSVCTRGVTWMLSF